MIVHISKEHREITEPHARRKNLDLRDRERERGGEREREREEKHEISLQRLIQFPSFWKCHIRVHEISDVLHLQQLLNLRIIY